MIDTVRIRHDCVVFIQYLNCTKLLKISENKKRSKNRKKIVKIVKKNKWKKIREHKFCLWMQFLGSQKSTSVAFHPMNFEMIGMQSIEMIGMHVTYWFWIEPSDHHPTLQIILHVYSCSLCLSVLHVSCLNCVSILCRVVSYCIFRPCSVVSWLLKKLDTVQIKHIILYLII
jgi:hypothetical protein